MLAMVRKTKLFVPAFALLAMGLAGSAAAKTKISILYWDPAPTAKWVEEFEKKNPNIQVECIQSGYDGYQKLLAMMAGGQTPDIMQIGEMGMPMFTNLLLPLDQFTKVDKAFLNSFYPMVVDQFRTKGKLYALSPDIEVLGLFYNVDMFAQSGLTAPDKSWNYENVVEAGRKLRRVGADGKQEQWGMVNTMGFGEWMNQVWSFGGELVDNYDAPTKSMLDGPNVLKAFDTLMSWINKEQVLSRNSSNFSGGKAGMSSGLPLNVAQFRGTKKFKWSVAPFPAGPGRRSTFMYTAGYGIARSSKNSAAAWQLIKYLNSEAVVMERQSGGHAVPAVKSVFKYMMEKDTRAASEGIASFEYMLDYIRPLPKTPRISRVEQALTPLMYSMLIGKQSPSQALAQMHAALNTILRTK